MDNILTMDSAPAMCNAPTMDDVSTTNNVPAMDSAATTTNVPAMVNAPTMDEVSTMNNVPIESNYIDAANGTTARPTRPVYRQNIRRLTGERSHTPMADMIWNHKVKTATLRQLVNEMERDGERIQQHMAKLRADSDPDNIRIAYLIAKICIDKDKDGLTHLENDLRRTSQSLRKLSRELKLVADDYQGCGQQHMYELLEGFVGALELSRGEDRGAWGEEGRALGAMRDRIKADMEWWNDGAEE